MQLGSAVSTFIYAIFAVLLFILLVTLLGPKVAEPTFTTYSDIEAHLHAQVIALSINALSVADMGSVEKDLKIEWDVSVLEKHGNKYLEVSNANSKSTNVEDVIVFGDVVVNELKGVKELSIIKEPGGPVKIRKIR